MPEFDSFFLYELRPCAEALQKDDLAQVGVQRVEHAHEIDRYMMHLF